MSYASYLQLNQLLSLQQPLSPSSEHRNENLFIITHQICELWFKQLIDEIHHAIYLIEGGNIPGAIDTMARINAITQTIINQFAVICTLKFQEFQRFRSYLGSASGFQSCQFACIEALLSKPNHKKLQQHHEKIQSIIAPVSLWEALRRHLMSPHSMSPGNESDRTVQSFGEIIKETLERPCSESLLLNQLLDLDSLLQEWRYRHIKLVERTIGARKGTGGSSGAAYLKSTLFVPFFDELWDAIN